MTTPRNRQGLERRWYRSLSASLVVTALVSFETVVDGCARADSQ